jgi:ribosomal protein L11 methyltransferase
VRWLEVSVTAPAAQVEAAGAALLRVCPQGLAERPARRGRAAVLQAYVPVGGGRVILPALRAAVRQAAPGARVLVRSRDDAAWSGLWKARARPVVVGRVVVAPSWWTDALPAHQAVVRIDPGMAFGSGEHPTTHLCLSAVDRYVKPGSAVIDVGTGSAVLAIAAARRGARRVVAVDNDPLAVRVARANVRANRAGHHVQVRAGDGVDGLRLRADLVVANLTAPTVVALALPAARRLRPGGRLVVSGFTGAHVPGVARALRAAGLRVAATVRRRGWVAVHAVRPP